jgi:hypothetical protein
MKNIIYKINQGLQLPSLRVGLGWGLLLFLSFSIFCTAQDKIIFEYDNAGNQTMRSLCLSINCSTTSKIAPSKEIKDLKDEDLQKFFAEDAISYYPNPVKEELYIKWELTANKSVSSVHLYDLNGREVHAYSHLEKVNTLNIPFLSYPAGTYLVILNYNDGEQKTIKIVKQ